MFWKVKTPTHGMKYQLLHGESLKSFAEEIEPSRAQQLVYKHLYEKVSSKK